MAKIYGCRWVIVIALDSPGSGGIFPGLEPTDTAPDPRETAMRKEICDQLDLLPQEQRAFLRLIFHDGRTESELCRELGLTQSALSRRKSAILQCLASLAAGPG